MNRLPAPITLKAMFPMLRNNLRMNGTDIALDFGEWHATTSDPFHRGCPTQINNVYILMSIIWSVV
ncbi:hypothetical protein CQ010_11885 [Arthrobacter sp. MYb211]|nr:hypothetical protein CQ010_11885 [Arthrobacter sp. MYb211]